MFGVVEPGTVPLPDGPIGDWPGPIELAGGTPVFGVVEPGAVPLPDGGAVVLPLPGARVPVPAPPVCPPALAPAPAPAAPP